MYEVQKKRSTTPKAKPDQSSLGFCRHFTDHMLTMDYSPEQGWHDMQIVPYGPLSLEPSSMVFHYAQEIFEGMKAYLAPNGDIKLFRPEMNARRFNKSCVRMCMPEIPEELFVQCVNDLTQFDKDWIPTADGTSLYLRPFIIATDPFLGVHASHTYKFIVIASPVGAYYPNGFAPIKIYVEDEYVRAVQGGTGFAKCGGNYAGSLKAQEKAQEKGYNQVLWLDGNERKYVEEVGAMNIMFKIDGEIVTAPIEGTILPGVTRESCLHILRDWGYKVNERRLPIDELMQASRDGKLEEAFGTGTAAVISPVGEICYKGETALINNFKVGDMTQKLYNYLTGVQWGKEDDKYGWTRTVK